MSDEGQALLAELREFRSENDRLLSEVETEIAAFPGGQGRRDGSAVWA